MHGTFVLSGVGRVQLPVKYRRRVWISEETYQLFNHLEFIPLYVGGAQVRRPFSASEIHRYSQPSPMLKHSTYFKFMCIFPPEFLRMQWAGLQPEQ